MATDIASNQEMLKKLGLTAFGQGLNKDFYTNPIKYFGGGFGKGDKNNVAGKLASWSGADLPNFAGGDVIGSPTGEASITDLPQYGGAGGSYQAAQYYAAQDFTKMFGRNPTASELSALAQGYMSGDPNIANRTQGQALLSQYYQSLANTPERIQAQKQKEYEAAAPKYYDEINSMYQQAIGRDATDSEKKHFGALRASGNVDAFTIGQFLNALPEAVQKQDTEFRKGLTGDLQKQDSQYYQEQILPALQQQAIKQGRSLDSSGVTNSLALAAQQQNRQREGFLSGLTAQQYGGSQALAQNAYQNAYGNYQGLQAYSMGRSNQLQDATTARVNELQNYQLQKSSYDDYLRRYGKRQSGLQGAVGGAGSGAMLGSSFGPWGALIGGVAGAGLGYFGSQGDN